jgi:Raf kinase inhibitor-like YbhB/YbcL family protein
MKQSLILATCLVGALLLGAGPAACRPSRGGTGEAASSGVPRGTGAVPTAGAPHGGGKAMTLTVTSPQFTHQGEIPSLYTCEGRDLSPPLAWSGLPAGTKSVALILDDPDAPDPRAPKMTWVHWVLYNLPPTATGLPEAVKASQLPEGTRMGQNDWKRTGYGGPCPPIGRHRYFHKVYALDLMLPDLKEPTKAQLEAAMKGHVLASGELVGTYQKKK